MAGRAAPAVCGQFGSLGVPCVNATVSGFTATSGAVRIRSADVPLRASVGLATGRPGEHDPDSLLHAADMAMYAVKEARRHLTASDLR